MVARAPIVDNNGHRPMAAPDVVDPQFISLSTQSGNQVRVIGGGLYVGNVPALPNVYVDSVAGVDTPTGGSSGAPFKTLDYAIGQITPSLAYTGTLIRFFLKIGQTYNLTGRYSIDTDVELDFGFYGDVRGDFTTVLGGTVPLWMLSNVARPVIQSVAFTNTAGLWSCGGFTSSSGRGVIRFYGVQVNAAIPLNQTTPPTIDTYGQADVVNTSRMGLYGTIGNKPDISPYGLFGTFARTQTQVEQFATTFTVRGNVINTPPNSTITAADLVARQHFFHFYPDFPSTYFAAGANRLAPSALTGSNGSGVMSLYWSDVASQSTQSTTTLATFPVLSDVNYGLTNYFYGLRRDQQSRPLNVISGRLF
jgi:hypothetical protein